jgi:hypothetical protein
MLSMFLDCPFWTTSVFFNVYLSAENDIMVKSYGNRKAIAPFTTIWTNQRKIT